MRPSINVISAAVLACAVFCTDAKADVGSRVIQKAAEAVIRRGGKEVVGETVETLTRKMATMAARYGDDVVAKAFSKVGGRAAIVVREAGAHSGIALRLLGNFGDDAIRIAARPKALGLVAKFGDDVAAPLIRHGEISEKLIEKFGKEGADALGKLSQQNVRRLAMLVEEHGEKVTPGLVQMFAKHGHADTIAEYVWRNKGALFVGGTLAAFVAKPDPFVNLAETVATKTLDTAVQPIATAAASQFPWGLTIVIGLFVGAAIVIERIGVSTVIKSGLGIALAKLKEARTKPVPSVTPKAKEDNHHDRENR